MMKRREFIKPEFIKPMGGVDGPAALSTSHRDQGVTNMRKIAITSVVLAAFGVFALPPSPAHAVNYETWVSGTGSDTSNTCGSQATPCREIRTALTNTVSGGTIHVLPGAYLAFIVNQGISIIADQGIASITNSTVSAGDSFAAIYINAPSSDVVLIRGMTVNQADLGNVGIAFNSGAALDLENCTLRGSGFYVPASLYFRPTTAASGGAPTELTVRNSDMTDNPLGNVLIRPSNGVAVAALIENTLMAKGLYGIKADDSAGSGMIRVDVKYSTAKGNTNNGFLAVGTGAGPVHFMIDHSTAENNGVYGAVATGANAFMIVTNSTLMGNGTGLAQLSGATVASTGTNTINFNTTQTSGTITPIAPK